MCGIVGLFSMTNAQDVVFSEKDKSFLIKYLLSELTIETEARGKDATGYFTLFQDKNGIGLKHGIRASVFCTKDWDNSEFVFKNHLNLIEAYHNEVSHVATSLAHCRAKTVGTETDNDNNHPIFVGDFAGIHNGCLSNHTKIYSNIKDEIERIGTVDSEMIVQLVWLGTEKGEKKFSTDLIKYITKRLEGSYAFICIDKKDPNSIMFMRDTRPIEFIYIRKAGLLVALSDKKFFKSVIDKYNWLKFYGVDVPKIEYEHYTFPDDKGFILKLDTEITSKTKIEDFIKDVIPIEKTDSNWAVSARYTGENNNYYNRSCYKCYNTTENTVKKDTDKKNTDNLPACYKNPEENNSGLNVVKDKNAIKNGNTAETNKIVQIKKVESNKEVIKIEQIRTATWNTGKKEFDTVTKNRSDMYPIDQNTSKYTIFTNPTGLAKRIGVECYVLSTLTSCQIANRVSKMMYEEHVEKLVDKIEKLKKGKERLEIKSKRARQHIIKLRALINIIVKILSKSYSPEQSNLTSMETNYMSNLWEFLYPTRKVKLKETKLGVFIQNLANKKEKTV